MSLEVREAEALRSVLADALADDQFTLNELEEEVVSEALEVLDPQGTPSE